MNYLLDRDGTMTLQPISAPLAEFSTLLSLFEIAVEQEKSNTGSIYELYELAKQVNDYSTVAALQWFLDEQVEEEKVMTEALGLMKFAGDDKSALLTLNNQFGKQVKTTTEDG
jgi:ferritin